MTECSAYLKKQVPLYRVVSAAVVDTHQDIGRVFQRYAHWAARGLKKLERESLRDGLKYVTLEVNLNTNTATLPPDFSEEYFVGVIRNGRKMPLKHRTDLVPEKYVEDIPCEDKCERCNQNKAICKDLTITEETETVIVNDETHERTIIKKLNPDGSYYLESRIPVYDYDEETVVYTTTKQYIASLDMKPCGCIDDTESNKQIIRSCNYDVWCKYYAECDNCCSEELGGYQIFEETGLIQLDGIGKFDKLYLEYWGFMAKRNGQYMVPEVAFETLVSWIKFKDVENRRGVSISERTWTYDRYRIERSNMMKVKGAISLSMILQAVGTTPKFDIDHYVCEPTRVIEPAVVSTTQTGECTTTATPPASSGGSGGDSGGGSGSSYTPYSIAVVAGLSNGPTPGTNVFQDDRLIGAIGVNLIIVNNTPETIQAGQFTLDTVTGTITRYQGDGTTPNNWSDGPPADILIVPTFFKMS
jgi:hypothetical protein